MLSKINLLVSGLYRRFRNFTESEVQALFADYNCRWGISPRPEELYCG